MLRKLCVFTLALFVSLASADEGDPSQITNPLTPEQEANLERALTAHLEDSATAILKNPESLAGYSRHGDALFFLGRFKEAVDDYDRMIELDESERASHWRRGIALFYAERYDDAAAQFESYHSFDQIDRENGIWRYLSQHRASGQTAARKGLLKYQKDDREPFPAVYRLFAGEITPEQIVEQIQEVSIAKAEREKRLFYAHLYIGLNYAVEGQDELAQKHLSLATSNTWAPIAGYGPHYMWHVGRLHESQLRQKRQKQEK